MRFFLVSCPTTGPQISPLENFDYDIVARVHSKIADYLQKYKKEQPEIAQKLMTAFMKMGHVQNVPMHTPIRVWTDVYEATREFASMVVAKSNRSWESPIQNILLAPKANGGKIFMGSPVHSWETQFSYKKESWMQVAVRVELFFNAIRADHDNYGIEDFIIFASPEILNMFKIMWSRSSWQDAFAHDIVDYSVTVFHQDCKTEKL